MKVFIVLAAVAVSCVSAGGLHGYAGFGAQNIRVAGPIVAPLAGPLEAPLAVGPAGSSQQFRSEDNYGNYQFGYDESHATGSTGRREERSGDVVRGSYNLADADGRRRTVEYIADATGFHAHMHTNEPGVDEARDPADVLINKEGGAVVAVAAPAPVLAAPAPLALPAPAPVAAPILRAQPIFATKTIVSPIRQAPAQVYESSPLIEAAPLVVEAPTPRAFSYSFGSSHPDYVAAAAPLPLPVGAPLRAAPLAIAAPAPIFQRGLKY